MLVAACGGISSDESEAKVKEIAEASTNAKVSKVDCPKAERKKGVQFQCTVYFVEGGEQTMVVTVLLEDGRDIEPEWAAPSVVSKTHLGEQL